MGTFSLIRKHPCKCAYCIDLSLLYKAQFSSRRFDFWWLKSPRVNYVIVFSFDSHLKNMNSKVVGKTETEAIWTISHYLFSVNETFVFWNRQELETLGTKDLGVIVCGLLWSLWSWLVTWGVRVQELVWWVGTTMNQNHYFYNWHKQLSYKTTSTLQSVWTLNKLFS